MKSSSFPKMMKSVENRGPSFPEVPIEPRRSTRWLFKIKTDQHGQIARYKARLVAQGIMQKFGEDYDQVFAPVVKQTTFRTLLSIASKHRLPVYHLDVQTAFLNGVLSEDI